MSVHLHLVVFHLETKVLETPRLIAGAVLGRPIRFCGTHILRATGSLLGWNVQRIINRSNKILLLFSHRSNGTAASSTLRSSDRLLGGFMLGFFLFLFMTSLVRFKIILEVVVFILI